MAFIEGEIRDAAGIDVADLQSMTDATVTIDLSNGKTVMLRNGVYTHDGDIGTEEANVPIRFEGLSAEEL